MNSIIVKHWFDIPKNYTGHVKHSIGSQAWYKDGSLHREDGPAYTDNHNYQEWCLNRKYYTKENYYRELYKRGIITEQELFIELL